MPEVVKVEACPECGTPGARVTYIQERDGTGEVYIDKFSRAVCRNPRCKLNAND